MATITRDKTGNDPTAMDWQLSASPPPNQFFPLTELERQTWPQMTPEARLGILQPPPPNTSPPKATLAPCRTDAQQAALLRQDNLGTFREKLDAGLAQAHQQARQASEARAADADAFDVEDRVLSLSENSHLTTVSDALYESTLRPWRTPTEAATGIVNIHPARVTSRLVGRRMVKTFATYAPVTPLQAEAKRLCQKFADDYNPQYHDGGVPGLTLYSPPGTVGCGKSHLMFAIGNALLAKRFKPVRYMRLKVFLDDLKSSFDKGGTDAVWRAYLAPRVVLLDDLGKDDLGKDAVWALNQLFELVEEWENLGTRVVRTTNDTPQMLEKRYGKPLASRLRGLSCDHIILLDGPDQRFARPGYESFFQSKGDTP